MKNQKFARRLTLTLAASLAFAGAASAQEIFDLANQGDIAALCGDKPTKIAVLDGYGGDTWRKITFAELQDEASKCPNITEITYSDAGGDQQKYNSDITSFASQQYNIIMALTDFGPAAIPAYRKAVEAGVTMVPWHSNLNGTAGQDYTVNPYQSQRQQSYIWIDWLASVKPDATFVFMGGFAGADASTNSMKYIKEAMANHPDLKLLEDEFIPANWNRADGQKAAVALIAKHPEVDAIITDYGPITQGVIAAYEDAGMKLPILVTQGTSIELNCKYMDAKAAGNQWTYMSTDGTTRTVRFALRHAMAAYQGVSDPYPMEATPFIYIDSVAGKDPICDPSFPPDADLSTSLTSDQLKALFN